MLVIGIRYLTGYAVATDVSDRGKAEWPPHPARVFMAMAAAYFETGEEAEERAALEWLEMQSPPAMRVPDADQREVVTHYVPVNDNGDPVKGGKVLMPLQSVALGRDRQPRTFPRVRPHDDMVYLLWPDATPQKEHLIALERLCAKVTRIGHSSSLVQMWVAESGDAPEADLVPDAAGEHPLRIAGNGTLDYLRRTCNLEAIEAYADLKSRIDSGSGKAKAALKREMAERFGGREPMTHRPTISLWQTYRRVGDSYELDAPIGGAFDRELMILSILDGPVIGLETTWQLLTALRDTILSTCAPVPEWISGHTADGSPSQQAHLAVVPLAFVGHQHADGHLLGVGLAFPKGIEPREIGGRLRKLLYDELGRPQTIRLVLGSLGVWTLARETRESSPRALQAGTWTGQTQTWATVTPIVLDRHPKADRGKDRERWSHEAATCIAESCERQGLPMPMGIEVDRTCWHRGGPRAVPGKGGGYPLMPVKPGQHARQQVHAWLRFDRDIEGPLMLGAGRYRGYGLCKPWTSRKEGGR